MPEESKLTSITRVVSLFSGAGGLDLGFVQAGFRPIFANDLDPVAVQTYNALIGPHADAGHVAVAGDVHTQSVPPEGSAEVVIGGPPCQGFSVAGKMDPNDVRSQQVFAFMDVVARVKPRAFVMENVKALYNNRRFKRARELLSRRAAELGYTTRSLLLNASHFGVPQARERMFFIGLKPGMRWQDPTPSSADDPPTVRVALRRLPRFMAFGNDNACSAKITLALQPVLRKSAHAGMLFNGQGRPLALDRPALTLPATMGGNRTPIVDQRCIDDPTATSWVELYHANLMAGGAPGGSVPVDLRRITVQEAAALQTFPPDTQWHGPQSAQYRQIGNAVPPVLGYAVAQALRQALQSGTT
jgi:DNA (cytosine-5)-methyltransferase 1